MNGCFHSPSTSPFKYHLNRTSIVLQMTIRPLFCGELPCDAVEINDTKSPKTAPRHHWAAEWRDREVRPAENARRFRPMATKRSPRIQGPSNPSNGCFHSYGGTPKSILVGFFNYKASVLVIHDLWKPQNKHLKKTLRTWLNLWGSSLFYARLRPLFNTVMESVRHDRLL